MKWARYEVGGKVSYGRIDGDSITEVEGAPWAEPKVTTRKHALKDVKLLIPVVPLTFYCVGINYRDHIVKMAAKRGVEPQFPPKPDIGYRANNALSAHEENIVKPKDSGEQFQYEGELVAVIGKRGSAATARCGARRTRTRSNPWDRGS
jgi:2-keto-4-pentenoate hydratase/2-oxohepta-3-ene-1,7-dioic acid hydratase in catechol pathway